MGESLKRWPVNLYRIYLYENDEVLCSTVYSFSYLVVTDTVMPVRVKSEKKWNFTFYSLFT